jgi:hypothetical protein
MKLSQHMKLPVAFLAHSGLVSANPQSAVAPKGEMPSAENHHPFSRLTRVDS